MSELKRIPTTEIKGIGEETAKTLKELGLSTVHDLLWNFPYRYEDYRLRDLSEVAHEERITIQGEVLTEATVAFYGRKKSKLSFRVSTEGQVIKIDFFNQPYLKSKISVGETVTISGKWDKSRAQVTASKIKIGAVENEEELEGVYRLKGTLRNKTMQKYTRLAFDSYSQDIEEVIPSNLLEKYQLMDRLEAVRILHFPKNNEELKQARRRMVYEEFLLFQLKMQFFRKIEREKSGGISINYDVEDLRHYIDSLPFPLTKAQKRVVNEICGDMLSHFHMNRLLQGDVGSGKTVVASIAMYAAAKSGFQSALMVPTEILAEQHANSLVELLQPFDITVGLLTSSVKGKQRRELLAMLENGSIDVLIGTHALIQDEVIYHRLGLVITDEQHRFGVAQRRVLREKGEYPDVLFMTATPIPRTLAITAFGEMDVSIIDELPAGRKEIETYWVKHQMLDRVIGFMEKEIDKGHQVYIICPLIEESEKLDVQNAIDVFNILQNKWGTKYIPGLMHGKLLPADKEQIMRDFNDKKIDCLVSTTVVEVGVNVPNATMMVIYDADRFGLAQLHQLRGRVGRGSDQSYCILIADPKTEVGKERMMIMSETNDGFVVSERDLELRGPGDFFGRKQSGVPEFKVADMVHDYRVLEIARQDAVHMIFEEDMLENKNYEKLVALLEEEGVFTEQKLD
ncbi:TPA_asm: DNA helicase RecG [Listeria monocytogenes]|uniref:ATP-dependent DNA helicase RecG n=1 Tax=Listeria monocytogenes TaxID=1639 RepID=UPI00061CF69C|nr:ATP-dependent DNA helicase RecG [Listeria monocytogenes]EAF4560402.1 ATP-dependent DNA helicase RecG [Listeria monocytogenes serotype 1/2a]EAC2300090.1 ATP-dependent DNA helicase RecG [Listeria monocytogenes]EAC3467996.1 ATP-dependent DNA helicase RecG [Listeria monocytogenes]EAC3667978.1 ATP-dependent DNA helicase RecG [Listeria monocytogenes]EAC5014743.1 ATP-dependent DNA helicase RecG [Listeria monocytogenes]